MLTDDQIIYLLTRDGSREDMLRASYRMGMLRAAEVCNSLAHDYNRIGTALYDAMQIGAISCAEDIHAEAGH